MNVTPSGVANLNFAVSRSVGQNRPTKSRLQSDASASTTLRSKPNVNAANFRLRDIRGSPSEIDASITRKKATPAQIAHGRACLCGTAKKSTHKIKRKYMRKYR